MSNRTHGGLSEDVNSRIKARALKGIAKTAAPSLAIRTAHEDRTLMQYLEDYEAYARRVRYRLLPGIW